MNETVYGAIDSRINQGLPYLLYSQANGVMAFGWRGGVNEFASGLWAGNHDGKNNPSAQDKRGVGPLPQGVYTILPPVHHPHLGVVAMQLEPVEGNEMFGRDAFWIHGPSNGNNRGQESMGCIIMPHDDRVRLWETGARQLQVVA